MSLFFSQPDELKALSRRDRNAVTQEIHRRDPSLSMVFILPISIGAGSGSVFYDLYRNWTGHEFFGGSSLAVFCWVLILGLLSNRYLYGPRFREAAANYFSEKAASDEART